MLEKVVVVLFFLVFSVSVDAQTISVEKGDSINLENTSAESDSALENPSGIFASVADMPLLELHNIKIPDAWKSEPAVVLSRSVEYKYHVDERIVLTFDKRVLERILLADQSAVEKYSEILFLEDEKVDVRVVKPNGTIVTNAYTHVVEKRVQSGMIDDFGFEKLISTSYNKMAVPNLQKGDVIEIIKLVRLESYWNKRLTEDIHSQYVRLQGQYPTIEQRFEIEIDDNFTLVSRAKNGASDFQTVDDGVFVLNAKPLDRYKGKSFSSYYHEAPFVKFAVFQCGSDYSKRFLGACADETTKVEHSPDDVRNAAWNRIYYSERLHLASTIVSYVTEHARLASDKDRAALAYYFFKHIALVNMQAHSIASDGFKLSNENFIETLAVAFDELNVPYEMVVLTNREFTTMSEMIMEGEMHLMLRSGKGDDVTYFYYFGALSDLQQVPAVFEGQEAYVFRCKTSKLDENQTIRQVTIPYSTYNDNISLVEHEVSLNLTDLEVTVQAKSTAAGHFKLYEAKRLLSREEIARVDCKIYKTVLQASGAELSRTSRPSVERWRRSSSWDIDEWDEKRKEDGRSALENGFNVYDYDIELLNLGWNNDSAFKYYETYATDGFLRRGGENFVLEVGKMIGNQIEVANDEYQRDVNVLVDFAKTYRNEIRVEIPEGYEAKNLQAFHYNVDNVAGSFVSSAKLEGNVVVISTEKVYKQSRLDATSWTYMTEFLDAAYHFTKQKLLLRKL